MSDTRRVSEEHLDAVRRAIAVNRSGPVEETLEVILEMADPEVEFHSRVSAIEGSNYRGHEGIRHYRADMDAAFREWWNEVREIEEVGPNAVIADITFHGIGKDSGMEVELRSAIVFVFAGPKIIRCLSFSTREEALAAADVSR